MYKCEEKEVELYFIERWYLDDWRNWKLQKCDEELFYCVLRQKVKYCNTCSDFLIKNESDFDFKKIHVAMIYDIAFKTIYLQEN